MKNMHKRRDVRKIEATGRKEERDSRSPQDQLRLLDKILGKDAGAKKERARLISQIKNPKQEVKSEEDEKS